MKPIGFVTWRDIPGKGRGVVAVGDIAAGVEIERSPVIFVPDKDVWENTLYAHYYIYWKEATNQRISLGTGMLPLYNHSVTPNVEFIRNYDAGTVSVMTLRAVKAEEELMWNYRTELWFDAV